jgi:hypothetical protein
MHLETSSRGGVEPIRLGRWNAKADTRAPGLASRQLPLLAVIASAIVSMARLLDREKTHE